MKILKVKCLAPTRLDNYLDLAVPRPEPGPPENKALRKNVDQLNGKSSRFHRDGR